MGGDDMNFSATDGFGASIPKANPKRNTILLTELDPKSMVVKDLRRELRSRGLDGNGLKKDLQARLIKHLETEKRDMEKIRNNGRGTSNELEAKIKPERLSEREMREKESAHEPDLEPDEMDVDETPPPPRLVKEAPKSKAHPTPIAIPKKSTATTSKSTAPKEKGKDWAKSEMAQRMARARMDKDKGKDTDRKNAGSSSTIKNLIHKAKEIFSPPKAPRSNASDNGSISSSSSSLSTSSNSSSSSSSSALTSAAIAPSNSFSRPPPAPPPGTRPSTFDKLLKLKKAESMRRDQSKTGASQPTAVAALKNGSTSAVINANKANQEEQARARMERCKEVQRQKALAATAVSGGSSSSSSNNNNDGQRKQQQASSPRPLEDQVKEKLKQMQEKKIGSNGDTSRPRSAEDTARMEREEKKAAMLKKVRDEALQKRSMHPTAVPAQAQATKQKYVSRPEDNYDISDREGSDSDSDSEDEAPRKRVPDWARSKELIPALQAQFCDATKRIDPDTIFPEVQSCDLEDIFDQKKSRYSRRTSSGEWTKDQITQGEKITYRKEMGFTS